MAEEIKLREYQKASIKGLRDGALAGHRSQVLMAPAGAGKTEIAAYLCKQVNENLKRAAFIVDRKNLVNQTSARFDKYGIPHGVIQSQHWRRRGYERIQVCSAQTIEKRGFFPELDLMIVDECHAQRKMIAELIRNRTDVRVIGLSATPFAKGMTELYTNLVNVCTTNELIEEKFLVPLQVYAARAIDTNGVKVVRGEWDDKEIEKRGMAIVGDIVSEWIDKTHLHFGGPVKTIVFSATVEHGNELCRQFNEQGYNFQQISYEDGRGDEERDALIEDFRGPDTDITGLVSCEVFTKGFDVPDILCGIGARPYRKSLSSHIQQIGRVMRPFEGKTFGLWLDHCGNVMRFGEDTARVFAEGLDKLDDGSLDAKARPDPTEKEKKELVCSCGFVLPPSCKACPACGKERERRSMVENVAGVMEAVSDVEAARSKVPEYLRDRISVWRQLCCLAIERKPADPAAARKFALAQFKNIYGHWPKQDFSTNNLEMPTRELKGKVQSLLIRRAHQVGRANAVR
jgi:superfamily II DNA or RNA helicase